MGLSKRTVCVILLLALVLPLTGFSLQFSPQPQRGTVGNTEAPVVAPKLPNLLAPHVYRDFWTVVREWLADYARYVASMLRERVGSYTSNLNWQPFIAPVFAPSNFGVTSTGSTSYPTTNLGDTNVESTANGQSANYLYAWAKFTTTTPYTIKGFVFYQAAAGSGYAHFGLYTDLSGPSSLVSGSDTGSVSESGSTGWITYNYSTPLYLPTSGTYWIAYTVNTTIVLIQEILYPTGSYTTYHKNVGSYGALPSSWPADGLTDSFGPMSSYVVGVQIEGYTKGTRVQYTGATIGNGAVSSFSFYTHTGSASDHFTLAFYSDNAGSPNLRYWYSASTGSANTTWNVVNYASGTTDNGWAGALTQNAYYWFMWQWDNVDSGPSYAAGGANTGIYLAQAYGTLLSTWSGGTFSTENWSMYLTYSVTQNLTATLSDSGSGSESASRAIVGQRSSSSSGSGSESPTTQQTLARSLSEAASGLASILAVFGGQPSISSAGSGSESLSRLFTGNRVPSDTGNGSESTSILKTFQRNMTDLASGAESVLRTLVFGRSGSEQGSGQDTLTKLFSVNRNLSDAGSGNTSISLLQTLNRALSDLGSGLDTVARLVAGYRTSSDSGSGQASLVRLLATSQSASSSGSGSESVSILKILQRSFTDAGSGLASLIQQLVFGRSVSDTGTGTASVSGQQVLQRLTSETGTGIESLVRQITFGRGPSDVGTGSESTSITQTINRLLSDLGSGIESILQHVTFTRSNSENGSGAETMSAQATLQKLLAESGTGIAVVNIQIVFGRTVTDLGSSVESLTAILSTLGVYVANISDQGIGSGTLSRLFTGNRSAADIGVGVESSSVQLVFMRTLADISSGLESLGQVLSHSVILTGQGTGSENLSRLFVASRNIFDLGSVIETLTSLFTSLFPPTTSGAGGGVIIKPLPTTVMVGALFPKPIYFLLPGASVSQDITVTNPTDTARIITVQYMVTDLTTGQIVYKGVLTPTVSPGSSTYTVLVTVTETGHYKIDITATDGGTATAKQEFDIGLWTVWQGPILLWSIIAFAAAVLFLFYRRIE